MNSIEASEINVPSILNSIEFMIKMSTKGIFLDALGFRVYGDSSYQKLETESHPYESGRPSIKTEYLYCAQPTIRTFFGGSRPALMYCSTRFVGDIRGIRSNLISYDYRDKEWAIKVEQPNQHFTVTHKIEPGNIPTDQIQDINDEAEMFQYSLTNPSVPDIVFQAARRMMELIQISPQVDAITMRMDSVVVDLEYLDLEEEFNRKQQGFQNF